MTPEEIKKLQEDKEAAEARAAAAEKKAEEATSRFSEQEKARTKDRIKATLDGLTEKGKLAPAGRPAIEAFMEALAGQDVVIKFSDDGKESTLLQKFEATVLASLGTVVKLGEGADTSAEDPAEKLSEEAEDINVQLGIDPDTYKKYAEKA